MRADAIPLEEERLKGITGIKDYGMLHERHRLFPAVFEERNHSSVLDLAAGVGVVAKRIVDNYEPEQMLCNDLSPVCTKLLKEAGMKTISFDLDSEADPFPLPDGTFDAVICLATLEHLVNIDHCVDEIHRILADDGRLYLSTPNYSGLPYLLPFLMTGKTFHDPMGAQSAYEFYAHIRYFTYRTLSEFVGSRGFTLETVYLGLPCTATKYKHLYARSRIAARICRATMRLIYMFGSPRWASEPILCCRKKNGHKQSQTPRKIIL